MADELTNFVLTMKEAIKGKSTTLSESSEIFLLSCHLFHVCPLLRCLLFHVINNHIRLLKQCKDVLMSNVTAHIRPVL